MDLFLSHPVKVGWWVVPGNKVGLKNCNKRSKTVTSDSPFYLTPVCCIQVNNLFSFSTIKGNWTGGRWLGSSEEFTSDVERDFKGLDSDVVVYRWPLITPFTVCKDELRKLHLGETRQFRQTGIGKSLFVHRDNCSWRTSSFWFKWGWRGWRCDTHGVGTPESYVLTHGKVRIYVHPKRV